jgi:hypothetical protein
MRRLITSFVAVMASFAMAGAMAATASAAPAAPDRPYCGIRWGIQPKEAGSMVQTRVRNVRAGQHPCFDRLVIDLGAGPRPGYSVRYVRQIVQDASGQPIPVKGGARLSIVLRAPARNGFAVNSHHLVNVTGFRTFRQVVAAGSFEGVTSFGLGVSYKLPFRVFIVKDPGASRVIIDVAHKWRA